MTVEIDLVAGIHAHRVHVDCVATDVVVRAAVVRDDLVPVGEVALLADAPLLEDAETLDGFVRVYAAHFVRALVVLASDAAPAVAAVLLVEAASAAFEPQQPVVLVPGARRRGSNVEDGRRAVVAERQLVMESDAAKIDAGLCRASDAVVRRPARSHSQRNRIVQVTIRRDCRVATVSEKHVGVIGLERARLVLLDLAAELAAQTELVRCALAKRHSDADRAPGRLQLEAGPPRDDLQFSVLRQLERLHDRLAERISFSASASSIPLPETGGQADPLLPANGAVIIDVVSSSGAPVAALRVPSGEGWSSKSGGKLEYRNQTAPDG